MTPLLGLAKGAPDARSCGMDRLLIEDLLGGRPLAWFMAEHWLRAPLAVPGAAAAQVGRASWDTVERLLGDGECDLLVARDGALRDGGRPGDGGAARALLADGWSLVLRRADRHDAGLADLAAALSEEFHGPINLQVYVTPPGRTSFGWHYDAEEVFIIQTGGAKDYYLR